MYAMWDSSEEGWTFFRADDTAEALRAWVPEPPAAQVSSTLPVAMLLEAGLELRPACWVNGRLWLYEDPCEERGSRLLARPVRPLSLRIAVPGGRRAIGSEYRVRWHEMTVRAPIAPSSHPLDCFAILVSQAEPLERSLRLLEEARFTHGADEESVYSPVVEMKVWDGSLRYGVWTDD